jgi:CRISPR-associated endonuclease/helicase Cas3
LRGVRRDNDIAPEKHRAQIERTDSTLSAILETHDTVIGRHVPASGKALHGLSMRLALSCLVDADHSNTANFDNGWTEPDIPDPRWPERLAALDRYVNGLGDRRGQRDGLRRAFYDACRHDAPAAAITACEGPVGIGKTTAVTAYLLGRAIATGARRLFIVAPYTAILSQTAERLREALVLPDEQDRADTVVAEHHHRADFDHPSRTCLLTVDTLARSLRTRFRRSRCEYPWS